MRGALLLSCSSVDLTSPPALPRPVCPPHFPSHFPSPICALVYLLAGCKHKGFLKDAFKGLVGIAGAAAGMVDAAMVEAHAFLGDEERVANAKKMALGAKDMAIAAAQAACAVVALAAMIPQVAAPAAAICAACKVAKGEL